MILTLHNIILSPQVQLYPHCILGYRPVLVPYWAVFNETNDLGYIYLVCYSYSLCKEIGANGIFSTVQRSMNMDYVRKIASLKKAPGAGTTISGCVHGGSLVKYGARSWPSHDNWMTLSMTMDLDCPCRLWLGRHYDNGSWLSLLGFEDTSIFNQLRVLL